MLNKLNKGGRRMMNGENGFTLIEMVIVLFIIAVLILLIIPTISNRSEHVDNQGCEALVLSVQTQADAYRLENGSYPKTINKLKEDNFITESQLKCKNDKKLTIDNEGVVSVQN